MGAQVQLMVLEGKVTVQMVLETQIGKMESHLAVGCYCPECLVSPPSVLLIVTGVTVPVDELCLSQGGQVEMTIREGSFLR